MHELIATAAVLVLLLAYSQIYIFIAGAGRCRSSTAQVEPSPPSFFFQRASRAPRFALFVVLFPLSPPFFLPLALASFCFCFFFPSFLLSLSRSPSVLLRCFAAHGFSRAACNSSGDLLRLIELWETRDENARRTSEREIVAYLVARGHRGRVCSFKYWTIVRLVTEKEMDRIRRNCDVLFQFLL